MRKMLFRNCKNKIFAHRIRLKLLKSAALALVSIKGQYC
ncbi:Uncharacterized protein dnm_089510 [Desulfonema magnum]|uniref:Uncharacterized protein n=1 Tax=Desulfonema magnum TaxID=45655 RepID=A0A975BWC3_9BACT|nr:Uncharacterized protein dnm_089490 [Desulfonema magnum]QTA92858.1 Uncharacterized protein dnm_089510 [Desulfonema magnum]